MIELREVSKTYHGMPVVNDVSIDLPKNALTAIIGPNGAGKSTLLSMIARLLPMSAGQVIVKGHDVTTTSGNELAKKLAILKQENHTTARLSVRDLVGFGRYPHSRGRLNDHDRVRIDEAIGFLGLEDLQHRFIDELSGGQRQRAYVAMVLCQDTDVILLDEPLNSLDIKHAVGMMKLLRRAVAELGKTVVVVLHDINFASCYADHIVMMQNGRIAHADTPEAVITPDIVKSVYDVEITVHKIAGQIISVYFS
jgi:iron complex transport system ATP-binding protein